MECGDYLSALNQYWGLFLTEVGVSEEEAQGILAGFGAVAALVNSGATEAFTGIVGGGGDTETTTEPEGSVRSRRLLLGDP